ncbi:MAG: tetratricopeptide repeat protein [Bacteroidetes bacterium]|nr:tetratricopeptide repeat protein [Bacteroidota bacterium]
MSAEQKITSSTPNILSHLPPRLQAAEKWVLVTAGVLVIALGAWFGYSEFYLKPREAKAQDAAFKAEEYYRLDSVQKALNGDGQYPGLLDVIKKYDGTKIADLACYQAGICYLKQDKYEMAIKYLGKFKTNEKLTQVRAYRLMADAYADWGKNDEALEYYQKAGRHFKDDNAGAPENLFLAARLADQVMKKSDLAINLYQEIKDKYPFSKEASQADTYLAQLGVYEDAD